MMDIHYASEEEEEEEEEECNEVEAIT